MQSSISTSSIDPHTQLRALYRSLLESEEHFHEFKQLLALYPSSMSESSEQAAAAAVRAQLNERIREWLGGDFEGLSAMQLLLWRSIVVEERFNVALSPWKEANMY
ncbi:MAG TPA: hypothetical protein VHU80_15135 [Polyangiaceae bacterium]|jgi:hypothetical protein|nr:hypothetical protein [Polyangiaceae bacterium]